MRLGQKYAIVSYLWVLNVFQRLNQSLSITWNKKHFSFFDLLFALKKKNSLYFFDSFLSQFQAAENFLWDFEFISFWYSSLINTK